MDTIDKKGKGMPRGHCILIRIYIWYIQSWNKCLAILNRRCSILPASYTILDTELKVWKHLPSQAFALCRYLVAINK